MPPITILFLTENNQYVCVAFELFTCIWCILRTGLYLPFGYCITCLKLLFSNRRVQVIFGMQVVRHAHWCAGLADGEDVEHAGGNLYLRLWVQFYLRL